MAARKIYAIGARIPDPTFIALGRKVQLVKEEDQDDIVIEDITHKRDGIELVTKGDLSSCFVVKGTPLMGGNVLTMVIPDKEVYQIFYEEEAKGKHSEAKEVSGG
jgi:hypothetical protein